MIFFGVKYCATTSPGGGGIDPNRRALSRLSLSVKPALVARPSTNRQPQPFAGRFGLEKHDVAAPLCAVIDRSRCF